MSAGKKAVLVVDDIESIRFAIKEYLNREFRVFAAEDGNAALALCEKEPIDLVITDIRMPGMGGLALIKRLGPMFPQMKFALMTAYNVDDYIRFARVERVWNIIPKTTFLDLKYILVMARKLLSEEIFGVSHYFPHARLETVTVPDIHRMHRRRSEEKLPRDVFYSCRISTAGENNAVCDRISDLLIDQGAPSALRMVLEELAANAMIHAPGKDRPAPDPTLGPENYPMAAEDAFDIGFGILEDNAVASVTDYKGSLNRDEALYRLERQTTADPATGLPIGLVDSHGRGLYISRENVDHLIFNIDPGKKTEIVGVLPLDSIVRTRAISIFQRDT